MKIIITTRLHAGDRRIITATEDRQDRDILITGDQTIITEIDITEDIRDIKTVSADKTETVFLYIENAKINYVSIFLK